MPKEVHQKGNQEHKGSMGWQKEVFTNHMAQVHTTLNNPIIVGHNNSLKPMLILIIGNDMDHNKFQPHVKFLIEN